MCAMVLHCYFNVSVSEHLFLYQLNRWNMKKMKMVLLMKILRETLTLQSKILD